MNQVRILFVMSSTLNQPEQDLNFVQTLLSFLSSFWQLTEEFPNDPLSLAFVRSLSAKIMRIVVMVTHVRTRLNFKIASMSELEDILPKRKLEWSCNLINQNHVLSKTLHNSLHGQYKNQVNHVNLNILTYSNYHNSRQINSLETQLP